jgi:hypothetical protein
MFETRQNQEKCVVPLGAPPDTNGRAVDFDHFGHANGHTRTFSDAEMRRLVGDALMLAVQH